MTNGARDPSSALAHKSTRALDLALTKTRDRLQEEIPRLNRRANCNLAFGVFFGTCGTVALFWAATNVVGAKDSAVEWKAILIGAAPRMSIALIVEFLAYFFLRLYSRGLAEVKYFANEITTSEMRLVALRTAVGAGDGEALRTVLRECAKTERNYRLSKDESTVELEREKMESASFDKILKQIGELPRKP